MGDKISVEMLVQVGSHQVGATCCPAGEGKGRTHQARAQRVSGPDLERVNKDYALRPEDEVPKARPDSLELMREDVQ